MKADYKEIQEIEHKPMYHKKFVQTVKEKTIIKPVVTKVAPRIKKYKIVTYKDHEFEIPITD